MIAIIPARGGSKGLPGKNIKPLVGKPMIAYTIEAALASKKISRVIVSTDDAEIARISKEFGAEVPFLRPKELAEDNSNAIDVYKYTIGKLEEIYGEPINEFMVLQPTSPLRTIEDIDNSIDLFKRKKADSVISFCEELHPITWHKYINDNGTLEPIFETKVQNRQEERVSYFPNGAIFIFNIELIRRGNYYSDKTYPYIMSRERSVDVDTLADFEYASFLLTNKK